jgi:phospholipid/cholesterol/gamma-HCH transport system ATP-binding protein
LASGRDSTVWLAAVAIRLAWRPEIITAPPAAASIVEVADLDYEIGGRSIFSGLNLSAERGRITAIMGPSGTGKTTLLRLLMGAIRPQRGQVRFFGEDVNRLSRAGIYRLRRRVGMLFQNGALLTDMSVFENVAFPLREHCHLPESLLRRLVLMKLQAVGLRGAAELMPASLSGGMTRRVALARAIVMDPEVLIYDEPFVGLDPISMGVILRLIQTLNASLGITSLVVTHDVQEINAIAHQSYLLSEGRVVAAGSPARLRDEAAPVVTQFMQGLADGPVPFHYPAPDYREQLLSRSLR